MKGIFKKLDSYINKTRKIGTSKDYSRINFELLDDNTLKTLYSADGIGKKIVDIKSKDMVREWVDIEEDTDGQILDALNDIDAKSVFLKALQLNKIFGGSIIYMLIDDGGEPEEELNINNIRSIKKIRAFARNKFTIKAFDDLGEPIAFDITTKNGESLQVHASRCLIFTGELALDEFGVFTDMEYWGFSEYQGMFNILGKLGISIQSIFDMMIKSNIDILKKDGLWEKLQINNKEGETEIDKMLDALDKSKSANNTILIDILDEYTTNSQNFAGIEGLLSKMQEVLSLVSGIAITILWGSSSKGLNSTGDNDVRRYYDLIKNDQEITMRNPLKYLIELLSFNKELKIKDGKYNFSFKSLWQLSEKEEVEIKKITSETDQIYINNAILDPSEVRKARFGGDKYSSDILVTGDIEIMTEEPEETKKLIDDNKSNN